MALAFHLVDLNPEVVKAWNQFFSRGGRAEITEGDIMSLDTTAIVTPANSFGIMEGGLGDCLNKARSGKAGNPHPQDDSRQTRR